MNFNLTKSLFGSHTNLFMVFIQSSVTTYTYTMITGILNIHFPVVRMTPYPNRPQLQALLTVICNIVFTMFLKFHFKDR